MNEDNSDFVTQLLMKSGFIPTNNPDDADLILINTCTVREKAQQKAFSLIGRMIPIKKRRDGVKLGVLGCVAQQEGADLIKRFPDIDLVLGTREVERVSELVKKIRNKNTKIAATDLKYNLKKSIVEPSYYNGRVKSYISIMEGCNNFCSYCIVPYVRGREISRSPEEIIREAEILISNGIKEITLLGQNVNSYCSKIDGNPTDFPMLLEMIGRIKNLARIRFTTSHPKDLSDRLIQCYEKLENLCPHIHLPFQSGSNRILKLMNRSYSRERYIELAERLRSKQSGFAITSDVMVGFPGEGDTDFEMTLDLIKKIEFDNLFSFKYSDRKGTVAEKMDGKISENEKALRLAVLQKIQKEITLKRNKRLIGKVEEVLVEGKSKKGGQYTGRTKTNKILNFDSDYNKIKDIVHVKVENAYVNSLYGRIINCDK